MKSRRGPQSQSWTCIGQKAPREVGQFDGFSSFAFPFRFDFFGNVSDGAKAL